MSPRDERGAPARPPQAPGPAMARSPAAPTQIGTSIIAGNVSLVINQAAFQAADPCGNLRQKPVVARNCSRRSPILWLVPARGGYAEHETPPSPPAGVRSNVAGLYPPGRWNGGGKPTNKCGTSSMKIGLCGHDMRVNIIHCIACAGLPDRADGARSSALPEVDAAAASLQAIEAPCVSTE
jgi:hypothetical protein